ncbi:hypothetical protein FYJ58_14260 [Lachnospiraceae bacterium WCA-693-APC-MOT-I]|nr:hypothetical protein [Velocimicrobium porci]
MFHRHTKAGTICRPVSGGMIPAVLLFHYFFLRLSALYANGPKRAVEAGRYDHSFQKRNRFKRPLCLLHIHRRPHWA